MTFTNPLALLWLLAVPAVVALHLFRQRLAERRVAASFLFSGERLVASAGRTRTRLLRTASLWLECLAAAALALWLAGPSFGGIAARHVVFVLDDSASMGMLGGAPGRTLVTARTGELAMRDRVTLLRTGPRPEVLLGPAAERHEVDAALTRWSPAQSRHDPRPALDLARELAGDTGEVVFVTDEPAPPGCGDIDVVAVGDPLANAAILTARRLPRHDGEELAVRIGAWGTMAGTALVVRSNDQQLAREAVAFRDGIADVSLRLPKDTGAVHLQLAPDALAIDDEAWLLPAPERTVAVCDLLPPELRTRLQMPRVLAALRGFRSVGDPRQAQLVVATKPGHVRPGQIEVVFAAGDGEPAAWRGPFVIDRAHPFLAGVQLQGVVWVARPVTLPGQVLIAVGAQPLASEEPLDAGRRLWIDLDPTAGNVVRSPDWPVLWSNLLELARRDAPGVEDGEVLLGQEARYRRSLDAGFGDTEVVFETPDGARRTGKGARTIGFVPDHPGLHRVLGDGGRELGSFAARFCDPSESDLRGLSTGTWPRTRAAGGAPSSQTPGPVRDLDLERRLLALLLLVLVVLDWWWLGRRPV